AWVIGVASPSGPQEPWNSGTARARLRPGAAIHVGAAGAAGQCSLTVCPGATATGPWRRGGGEGEGGPDGGRRAGGDAAAALRPRNRGLGYGQPRRLVQPAARRLQPALRLASCGDPGSGAGDVVRDRRA